MQLHHEKKYKIRRPKCNYIMRKNIKLEDRLHDLDHTTPFKITCPEYSPIAQRFDNQFKGDKAFKRMSDLGFQAIYTHTDVETGKTTTLGYSESLYESKERRRRGRKE